VQPLIFPQISFLTVGFILLLIVNLKRPYLGLKWLTGSVFTAHLILGWVLPENNVVVDLILFNLIGIAAAAIAFNAPLITDRISANSFGLAALSWSFGSFFFNMELLL
jgi:hypothetical protein